MEALWRRLRDGQLWIGYPLALRWADLEVDAGDARIRCTLTRRPDPATGRAACRIGDRAKSDKSRRGVAVPAPALAVPRQAKAAKSKCRLRLGPAWHDGGLVFERGDGRFLAPDGARVALTAADAAPGMPWILIYSIRHTCAASLVKTGVLLTVVQERADHLAIAVTATVYVHLARDADRGAAEALERALGA